MPNEYNFYKIDKETNTEKLKELLGELNEAGNFFPMSYDDVQTLLGLEAENSVAGLLSPEKIEDGEAVPLVLTESEVQELYDYLDRVKPNIEIDKVLENCHNLMAFLEEAKNENKKVAFEIY